MDTNTENMCCLLGRLSGERTTRDTRSWRQRKKCSHTEHGRACDASWRTHGDTTERRSDHNPPVLISTSVDSHAPVWHATNNATAAFAGRPPMAKGQDLTSKTPRPWPRHMGPRIADLHTSGACRRRKGWKSKMRKLQAPHPRTCACPPTPPPPAFEQALGRQCELSTTSVLAY